MRRQLAAAKASDEAAQRELLQLRGQLQRSEQRLVDAGKLLTEAEARGSAHASEASGHAAEIESKYRASLVQIRTMQEAAIKVKKIHESEAAWLSESLKKAPIAPDPHPSPNPVLPRGA